MVRRYRPSKRREDDTRPASGISVDVEDRGEEFVVTADLPGVRKQDIDVQVKKNRVRILVEPEERESDSSGATGPFARRARERGPLSRTVRLPAWVNERRTNAEYRNGRLRMTLPKRRRRRVKVE